MKNPEINLECKIQYLQSSLGLHRPTGKFKEKQDKTFLKMRHLETLWSCTILTVSLKKKTVSTYIKNPFYFNWNRLRRKGGLRIAKIKAKTK